MPEVYDPITLPDLFEQGPFGLSSAVNWLTNASAHWQGGVQYDSDCTEVAVTMMECISGATISGKVDTWSHVTRGSRPFTIYDKVSCSPIGSDWWDVATTKALRALVNSGPVQLERTFWSGVSNAGPALVYPNLTSTGPIFNDLGRILLQPATTAISGTPLDVVEGLGALEAAFGTCYDGAGVIHVPFRLGAALAANYLIYEKNNKLYTYGGNQVVLGRGYPTNIGPGGSTPPAGSTWMFATSPIFGLRATPRTFTREQSFDRSVNTLSMIAEQTHLLGWTCCLAGVLVTTGGLVGGSPTTAS